MWMRVAAVLVMAGVALGMGIGAAWGQEEPQHDTTLFVGVYGRSDTRELMSQFLQVFELSLTKEQIAPVFVETQEVEQYGRFWEHHAAIYLFLRNTRDVPSIQIAVYTSMRLSTSPMLEPTLFAPTLEFSFENEAERNSILDLATGIALYAIRDCNRATPYFENALNDENLPVHDSSAIHAINFYLANCEIEEQDYDTAQQRLESIAATVEPHYSPSARINLAWLYWRNGRESEAIRIMDNLVQYYEALDPLYLQLTLVKRSQLYALAFRFDEAITDMDTAIEVASQFDVQSAEQEQSNNHLLAQLHVERGQRILLLYEWDRVLEDYNTAIELDPTYADAYYYRGILFYTQGQRDEALPDFARYLELAPDGEYAAEAAGYIEDIEDELAALDE